MRIDWHIGDVIAKLRKHRRMNQTVMAKRVGVSKATIVRAEDGDAKVSRATYVNIARVLGIDLATLEVEAARLTFATNSADPMPSASEPHTVNSEPQGIPRNRDGRALAPSGQAAQTTALPIPPYSAGGDLVADLLEEVQVQKALRARAAGKSAAAPRVRASGDRDRGRRSRR